MSTPAVGKFKGAPRATHRVASSTHTSPSVHSSPLGAGIGGVALSSLRGDYIHAVIQVTRDMIPVVFSRWTLSFEGVVDFGVADLTLAQLLRIAEKENLVHDTRRDRPTSTSEWARSLSIRIIPLRDLLQVCAIVSSVIHSLLRQVCARHYPLS